MVARDHAVFEEVQALLNAFTPSGPLTVAASSD